MKKNLIVTSLLLLAIGANSQTKILKQNITLGGGRQSYNGDLGNAWLEKGEEWYGFVTLGYNRYLNKSFDVNSFITHGDYGHCREDDENEFRPDGSVVLNMRSRKTTIAVGARYKFANGYILKENAKFSPYLFLGFAENNLVDFWSAKKDRVNNGNYMSVNAAVGINYNFAKVFHLNYNVGIGNFTKDNLDNKVSGSNDKYLQSSFSVGYNF